jgi:tRNA threonylcarbamoyladenosine modification (KEOPS) complex  Pcc1 subunit
MTAPRLPRRVAHSAQFDLACPDPGIASAVAQAMAVEAGGGPEDTGFSVHALGASVVIVLEAKDLSGLRAAVNSAVRLADAAIRTASTASM